MKQDKNLIDIIKNLKWNEKNLKNHTKKHPINESINLGSYKWGNILGFFDITDNFNKTKKAYKNVTEEILKNVENAIMYYHIGPNNSYCSGGIFEDKEDNKEEKLTVFIQSKNNHYFITTAYLRKIGLKERLYFAYEILNNEKEFKSNLSMETFKQKVGLPEKMESSNINELTNGIDENDIILKAYREKMQYGKPTNQTMYMLVEQYKYMFYDIQQIERKIEVNNKVIKLLEEKYDEIISEYKKNKMNEKDFSESKTKVETEEKFQKINNILFEESLKKLKRHLNEYYKGQNITKRKIDNLYNINGYFKRNLSILFTDVLTSILIPKHIEKLKKENKDLDDAKTDKLFEMQNSEDNFYASLYKHFIDLRPDYKYIINNDLKYIDLSELLK